MKRLSGVIALLLLGAGCELPWSSARVKLTSERWTDYIQVELQVKNVTGALFGCATHKSCVDNIRLSLEVPSGAPPQSEQVMLGAELVEGGAENIALKLVGRGDEVDLHASFSAPSTAKLFSGVWLPNVDTGAVPTMSTSAWSVEEPEDLPSSGGIKDGVMVTYIDLTKAPKHIVLKSDGNPDALPLYLALPGLRPVLATSGLIEP